MLDSFRSRDGFAPDFLSIGSPRGRKDHYLHASTFSERRIFRKAVENEETSLTLATTLTFWNLFGMNSGGESACP